MADATSNQGVRVEMHEDMLKRLLAAGQVCAADFRCLDGESKQRLWRLCLECCAYNMGPRHQVRTVKRR